MGAEIAVQAAAVAAVWVSCAVVCWHVESPAAGVPTCQRASARGAQTEVRAGRAVGATDRLLLLIVVVPSCAHACACPQGMKLAKGQRDRQQEEELVSRLLVQVSVY